MPFDTTTTARAAVTIADALAAPGLLIYRGPSEIDARGGDRRGSRAAPAGGGLR